LTTGSGLLVEAADSVDEAVQGGRRRYDAATAPQPVDQAEIGETGQSLSNDAAGDPEPLLQFFLGRKRVPGHEHLILDLLAQDVADLHMQRTSIAAVDLSLEPLG
jgi:hypothetical protein